MQTHEELSHCYETSSEIQEMKMTDKLKVPGPGDQPEAHLLLDKGSHVGAKGWLAGCKYSWDLDSDEIRCSLMTDAAFEVSEAADQYQFVKVKCMALFHIHIFPDQ